MIIFAVGYIHNFSFRTGFAYGNGIRCHVAANHDLCPIQFDEFFLLRRSIRQSFVHRIARGIAFVVFFDCAIFDCNLGQRRVIISLEFTFTAGCELDSRMVLLYALIIEGFQIRCDRDGISILRRNIFPGLRLSDGLIQSGKICPDILIRQNIRPGNILPRLVV